MIKEEDLISGTTAKYGIEFESIIVDISNKDYICIDDNKLYDTIINKSVTNNIHNFMGRLVDFDIPNLFEYHVSGLNCNKPPRSDKRLEFASYALSPTNRKPSELFDTLEKMINAFNQWTDEKYYLPDHGTISFLSDDKKQVYTTLTGGTHMTISFPLTKIDNPVTWKCFMWLFTGLVTIYQPIYVALNGAPSYKTKGSERQRTSGSIVIGSAYIYDIFTPESERYEIFINTPSDELYLPDYPEYAHWNDKDLSYKRGGPWRGGSKADIGNSDYNRSDFFNLYHRNSFITDDKEKVLNKQFYEKYDTLINNIASMTSNLIEFRFFDNEPIQHLHNKFNLLIRIADYAYEHTKNMETAIGIEDLKDFLPRQIDDRLNIRPLVNKKPWHDAVLESMNEGLDATFNKEFIDECYEFLSLTPFSILLENPELKEISAIDLNKIFVDEINTAEHHFSEYFQTNNPTSDYSKEYQIEKLNDSKLIAEEKMKVYTEEKARKDEEERLIKEKIEEDQRNIIIGIIITNIDNEPDKETLELIKNYIDINKLAEKLRIGIYELNYNVYDINGQTISIIYTSLSTSTDDEDLLEILNSWFRKSLLPDLRNKEPRLRTREDTEDRNIEIARERVQQLQREREKIEEQINFIANIITKNITNITDETLQGLVLTTIHLRKISDMLREVIYVDRATISNMDMNITKYLYASTLEDVRWNDLVIEKQNLLIKWFRESLLPDLESNVPELHSRSQPQTTTGRIIPQTEADKKREIFQIIVRTVNRLNDVSRNVVVTTILYNKLMDILHHRIYVVQQSFNEIEEISELIIKDATPENTTRTFEQDDIVRAWFKVGLLSELRDTLLLTRTQPTQYPQNSEDQIVVIQKEIRNNVESITQSLSDEVRHLGHLIYNKIGFERCAILLQKLIYEENYTTSDIRDHVDEIIEKTKFGTITDEEYPKIKFWIQGILIDLLKKVTPIRETRGREPLDVLTEQSTQQTETRQHGDVTEHRHGEYDYWHPEIRIHPNLVIGQATRTHIFPETSSDPISDEKDSIYYSILQSINQVDNNSQSIINMYIDHGKLVDEIYTRIKDDYSTNQIKGMANLITQTSIFDNATIPENKKEIIDAWFVAFLIPQLIQDNILNSLQETEEEPTTYATELEAVESGENERLIILDIIRINIIDLENPEMRNIVLKYILLKPLAKELHELIYILKYNTLELRNHSLALLIQKGFYDEFEEDYVKDPEVISLLKIWIEDYLIPDLVKGTPLELGGISALFG